MSAITTDEVVSAAAIVGGIVTNRFIDVGTGWVANTITFLVGAVPTMLVTETAMNDDGLNLQLIQQSVDFMTQYPTSFAMVTVGIVSGLSIAFNLLLGEELIALEALVPFFRTQNIDLAVVALGLCASLVFGGICGWTVEVIEWVVDGSHSDTIPCKPNGRTQWGLEHLPKDVAYLIFAVPIGIFQQFELGVQKSSLVPLFMVPLKIAADQWSRVGDILIDMQSIEKVAGVVLKDSWKCFDDICHKLADNSGFVLGITFPKSTPYTIGYTDPLQSAPKSTAMSVGQHHSTPPPSPPPASSDDVYGALRSATDNGTQYHFHPFLFSEGDATAASS